MAIVRGEPLPPPATLVLLFHFRVREELHERREGCVRTFDLHQKWEDEGGS